ncbi:ADP-ribosylation factor GTPase-activating protein AGD2-like isoform X3 [Momordica charantia]|uniref:ADP-ribosylation factor GTPase-activating protein AGD2-like isoform X3 n=1 Tax=Momordica charantia TaxID=3673 RepID=A0A6J1D8V5_MOMCH|nr:ADP-ribosylation factor GTPase-activating protein AGD2-like isoform X3 [Momordica charantia]
MAAFVKLEDSPMFLKQIFSLEKTTDELEDRCKRLHNGCKMFMATLGEACNGDISFADSLEGFGGGQDDPVSVSIGGPVISKFITAFRELATYKEQLRSQVEHVLTDRLMHFLNEDLQGARDSRQRFDKAMHVYDQAREKFVSLKKSTRGDIVAGLEEDLVNSKSEFEKSRFNLVNALMNVEAKKKYEFLESISSLMDAHLRYFKLVLTYAQQSKELANIEQDKLAKRIQEFRTQAQLDNLEASNSIDPSVVSDGIHGSGISSYRNVEAAPKSIDNAKVKTTKQGYLLKRSSGSRGDWKRRFFVLDSQGALYYYRNKGSKYVGPQSHSFNRPDEHNNSMFGRFRARHNRTSSLNEEILRCCNVNLHTSTIKMDAEDSDLRLCFRIISPSKTYTLQAENEADRLDWVNKITGAIASLFNSFFLQQPLLEAKHPESDKNNFDNSNIQTLHQERLEDGSQVDSVSKILREIPGNDLCAECGTPEPEWASLNLGVLLCIECSGVHRNLGVHISKVRSITLDVKVWEPSILNLFRNLGNSYCNSIWEELLLADNGSDSTQHTVAKSIPKPSPRDAIQLKERYIQAKYVEKLLVVKDGEASGMTKSIWEAVKTNDLQKAYHLIAASTVSIVNTTFHHVVGVSSSPDLDEDSEKSRESDNASSCGRDSDSKESMNSLRGCSLLHLACQNGNQVMVELLLQFGADINVRDSHGRTPLHQCISQKNNTLAKLLLRRGARPSIKDGGGLSALERAMEMGAITDEELFLLLTGSE